MNKRIEDPFRDLSSMQIKKRTPQEKRDLKNKKYGIVQVNLTPEELELAEELSYVRNKDGSSTTLSNHYTGVFGEIVVAKYLNSIHEDPFCKVDESDQPDSGFDLSWKSRLIDVKCTTLHKTANLCVSDDCLDNEGCDYFVMVRRGGNFGLIEGCISLQDFERESYIHFGGQRQCSPGSLMPISLFAHNYAHRYVGRLELRKHIAKITDPNVDVSTLSTKKDWVHPELKHLIN